MRVAIWHNLPSGGGLRAMYEHVRGLLTLGHEVEVWAPPTANRQFLDMATLTRYHEVELDQRFPGPCLRYPDLYVTSLLRAMDAHCRRVAAEIQRTHFDILLCGSCSFFATNPLARYVDIPSVLYLGEPYRRLFEWPLPWRSRPRPSHLNKLRHKLYSELTTRQLRHQLSAEVANASAFSSILVNSYYSLESVQRAYGLASRVCYLGVDIARWQRPASPFPVGQEDSSPIVVGLGYFSSTKGVDFVIRSLSLLPKPRPRLYWVGNVAPPNYLRSVIQQAREADVDFRPFVGIPDSEVVDIMHKARALAYPPRLEPFGYAPLEAAASGVPTVGVAEGGVRETVIDGVTGLLTSRDEQEMALALDRVLSDDVLAKSLGDGARKAVEQRWKLSDATARLEYELQRVLQQPSKRRFDAL